jgi:hypothetical protein
MQNCSPISIPQLRILGRTAQTDGALNLFWSASGIEFLFTGSELSLSMRADWLVHQPWLDIELNGAWMCRMPVPKGESTLCVLSGMAPGVPKHVRIFKDTQAMNEDDAHLLQLTRLSWAGGAFLPLPPKKYRIEFVGDSITTGEGTMGAQGDMDWLTMYMSCMPAYARLTADALDADFHVLSASGWGILSGWDNDPRHALPLVYEKTCGTVGGARNAALGAGAPWDFSAWQPDALVINLGTNDDGAFRSPAWLAPETGRTFQEHLAPDGSYLPADAARLSEAVAAALAKFRHCNPHTKLVWAYGMLGGALWPILHEGIRQYRQATGDAAVYSIALPDTLPADFGSRGHAGVRSHQAAACVLTEFLRTLL